MSSVAAKLRALYESTPGEGADIEDVGVDDNTAARLASRYCFFLL